MLQAATPNTILPVRHFIESAFGSQIGNGVYLIHQFLSETKRDNAFTKLDALADWVIAEPAAAEKLVKLLPAEILATLQKQVLEVDAIAEKKHARDFITAQSTSLKADYPWYLEEYHKSELAFIASAVDLTRSLKVLHIGHGAISPLSYLINEVSPKSKFTFSDLDPEMTTLAREIIGRVLPEMAVQYQTADIQKLSLATAVDLCIVANAAAPALMARENEIKADYIFVRSATAAGSLLYPSFPESMKSHYEIVASKDDPIFNIHKLILLKRNSK